MKMNPEVKARWVAALRSGEYKQAHGDLRKGDGFCCLGVLCDLHAQEHNGRWDEGVYEGAYALPPDKVCEWAGLPSFNPKVIINGVKNEVAVFNDGANDSGLPRTFAEIADAIEKQL